MEAFRQERPLLAAASLTVAGVVAGVVYQLAAMRAITVISKLGLFHENFNAELEARKMEQKDIRRKIESLESSVLCPAIRNLWKSALQDPLLSFIGNCNETTCIIPSETFHIIPGRTPHIQITHSQNNTGCNISANYAGLEIGRIAFDNENKKFHARWKNDNGEVGELKIDLNSITECSLGQKNFLSCTDKVNSRECSVKQKNFLSCTDKVNSITFDIEEKPSPSGVKQYFFSLKRHLLFGFEETNGNASYSLDEENEHTKFSKGFISFNVGGRDYYNFSLEPDRISFTANLSYTSGFFSASRDKEKKRYSTLLWARKYAIDKEVKINMDAILLESFRNISISGFWESSSSFPSLNSLYSGQASLFYNVERDIYQVKLADNKGLNFSKRFQVLDDVESE